ncbi:serine/threonine protein phosphatase [Mycobacterium sp. JS623]|uniref:PP2C family protein-serine/threonine phosphatase n=1 Tax=Mycobacterium sp. JS623 TaxID=212767 RepID=UPI0002A59427|nr:PP2C family protein-serine/threonine phosphatase [Mycobacterium sp. JS623]AGB25245.1 serine/threonine protein phosphatase [Mycobacterium sp. JS623]
MTSSEATCPHCATAVAPADRFCEDCGGSLSKVRTVAIPRPPATDAPCTDCGNEAPFDEYCTVCGHRRAQPDRDESTLGSVVLITDRGIEHAGNEDAAAAGMSVGSDETRPDAIAVVVCDGVSSSDEAHKAAVAASKAGVDAMLAAIAASKKVRAAMLAGLAAAAEAAVAAGTDSPSAPSCTYTAMIVIPTAGSAQVTVGNVGDSRAYWLPDPPASAQQLTVDDSLSQELITAGASPDSEAVRRGAHTLTRWLGADSDPEPWSESSVQTMTADGPGALLLCSDGLWNYLPEAADIARFCIGVEPSAAARALTEYALDAGGQDNITVVIIPIGGTP